MDFPNIIWEYKTAWGQFDKREEALNLLGRDGWELISFDHEEGRWYGVFKRMSLESFRVSVGVLDDGQR